MQRRWINQPSTQQPHHNLNGVNVLAEDKPRYPGAGLVVYFLQGALISTVVPANCLSWGWKEVDHG